MPQYTINFNRLDADPEEVCFLLYKIAQHATALGFMMQGLGIGTGGSAGKLQVNISRVLTAEEQAHLGLS